MSRGAWCVAVRSSGSTLSVNVNADGRVIECMGEIIGGWLVRSGSPVELNDENQRNMEITTRESAHRRIVENKIESSEMEITTEYEYG